MTVSSYSVPAVAREILDQLLADPRLAIPDDVKAAASEVTFEGSDLPFSACRSSSPRASQQ